MVKRIRLKWAQNQRKTHIQTFIFYDIRIIQFTVSNNKTE